MGNKKLRAHGVRGKRPFCFKHSTAKKKKIKKIMGSTAR